MKRDRGPGVTFFKPQREPIRWVVVFAVVGIVVGGLAVLVAWLVLPVLMAKGMPWSS